MMLPRFTYLRAATLEEARQLLNKYAPKARLVAGGTELFPRMKYHLDAPEVLIGVKRVQPHEPAFEQDNVLVLDALMTLTALSQSSVVLERAPLLAEAARRVASNEIRNMGTLGGNLCQESRCLYYNQRHLFQFVDPCFKRGGDLCYFVPKARKCHAVYMSDTAPALLCLGAEVKISGPKHERRLPLENLFSRDAKKPLKIMGNEMMTHVLIPHQTDKNGCAFNKFSLRGGLEFAVLSIAVVLQMEDNSDTCSWARIAVGAVAASPKRALKAESHLKGERLSQGLFAEAAQIASDEIHIVPHHGFSGAYLRELLKVQAKRTLIDAAKKIR